jgi:nitroreductase family protein
MPQPERKARPVPFPADAIEALLATAARAPSILNTQPWRFTVGADTIELSADASRRLRADLTGREMVISCGAALFGLRLGIRALGYQPVVTLVPYAERPHVLARVRLGERVPMTATERGLLRALPHRHTHRGGYLPRPLPRGLLVGLQHDAVAEQAALALIDRPVAFRQLAGIVARSANALNADARSIADAMSWVRLPQSGKRDGVPAAAIAGSSAQLTGGLAQRDLDLGRGIAGLDTDGAAPAATAILLTSADTKADWLRAGQALHRLLAHAAGRWVFAALYSQPFGSGPVRAMIRNTLGLSGVPHLVLQFGLASDTKPTARRPAADIVVRRADPAYWRG